VTRVPVYEYDPPERFVAGTVGEPGQRTFFLQASGGGRVTSVSCEKAQVAILAERIGELLDLVVKRSGGTAPVPAALAGDAVDTDPLQAPIEEDFRVGVMSLAWDPERAAVVVEALQVTDSFEVTDPAAAVEADPSLGLLRVSMSGAAARAFVARAEAVVRAGRPPCPWCAEPLDPAGHVCPRQNGYRR
jgi:uncharacterized repeat protein (TIGR03847 family)